MSFDNDWDVEYYRTDYESEEHWNLRKKFMEVHKDKFPEDELVCLAQVFTNVEFMGCKYPDETMLLVGELSQDVAADFRKNRASRLKRTFVKASDAAEARAKGRRTQQSNSSIKKTNEDNFSCRKQDFNILFKGLKYGQFILFKTQSNLQDLKVSAIKSNMEIKERVNKSELQIQFEWLINDKVLGVAIKHKMKEAKIAATELAIKELEAECYSIKENIHYEKIQIDKNGPIIGINDPAIEKELDSSNVGFKMMKKQGWTGGGLGFNTNGIQQAIDLSFTHAGNRKGLGYNDSTINQSYLKTYLQNYLKSDDIRDINFDPAFTKTERETMHSVITQLSGLISNSVSSGENRRLTIRKKILLIEILEQVLIQKSPEYIKKFRVQVPISKAHIFPEHAKVDFV